MRVDLSCVSARHASGIRPVQDHLCEGTSDTEMGGGLWTTTLIYDDAMITL